MSRRRRTNVEPIESPGMKLLISELLGGRPSEGADVGPFEARVIRIVTEAFEGARQPRKRPARKARRKPRRSPEA